MAELLRQGVVGQEYSGQYLILPTVEISHQFHSVEATTTYGLLAKNRLDTPLATRLLQIADTTIARDRDRLETSNGAFPALTIEGEKPQEDEFRFSERSVLLDMSRGAVYTPEFLRQFIDSLEKAGGTSLCLYTEIFEMDGLANPRDHHNALSESEIREVVEYGQDHHITVYPAIETLSHLERLLVLPEYREFLLDGTKDTVDLSHPSIYESLLYPLIENAARAYRTDKPLRMNIGGDESEKVAPHQYAQYLKKMKEICQTLAIDGEIWADQIVAMSSEDRALLPRGIPLSYWNYDEIDASRISSDLKTLKEEGFTVRSASSSAFIHNKFYPDTLQAKHNISAVTEAAEQQGIPESMLTIWHDDGAEAPLSTARGVIKYFFEKTKKNNTSDEVLPPDYHPLYDVTLRKNKSFIIPNTDKVFFYENPTSFPFSGPLDFSLESGIHELQNGYGEQIRQGLDLKEPERYIERVNSYLHHKNRLLEEMKNKSRPETIRMTIEDTLGALFTMWMYHRRLWNKERFEEGFSQLDSRYLRLTSQFLSLHDTSDTIEIASSRISSYPNARKSYKDINL